MNDRTKPESHPQDGPPGSVANDAKAQRDDARGEAPIAWSTSAGHVPLSSLAPRFEEPQHSTYLNRLTAAVEDASILNIALTGRYGAGKSSVLAEFVKTHSNTRRLSISTLSPEPDAEQGQDESAQRRAKTVTNNRIQKELVKQLIYSADDKTLRHSRFSRVTELDKWRAFWESAGAVSVILVLLRLVGWLPTALGRTSTPRWELQLLVWVVIAVLLAGLAMVARVQLHNRFFVSDVAAAGTTLRLSPRTPTFFDEYLEEIVNYFDEEPVDFVVLEDLDRFDNESIFEALRELNTLLNNTPKRKKKGTPLRFIYAVRDSLFQKLGTDDDAATAETQRANRTKFFDLVIPIVPFISHRNAQDLLEEMLDKANITGIDRPLIDLVARHATDMRLLRNIRNEYLIFAERLLEQDRLAPGLKPNGLFALVAYKNFHLADFEEIARRCSSLDILYESRRELVARSVANAESARRELLNGRTRGRQRAFSAQDLGDRLARMAKMTHRDSRWSAWTVISYQVGTENLPERAITTPEFWSKVASEREIVIQIASDPTATPNKLITISGADLDTFFAGATEAPNWEAQDEAKLARDLASLDADISFLRGADFAGLAARPEFKLPLTAGNRNGEGEGEGDADSEGGGEVKQTFADLIDQTLASELARELVKRGYIDRNFSLYAAQFYGEFTGVDVATFMVQAVQPNVMELDAEFTSDGAVDNLLHAAGPDFTHSKAALNRQVVTHLLQRDDDLIRNVVDNIIRHIATDPDTQKFLTSYLGTGKRRATLAAQLSKQGWTEVFNHLMGDDVTDAERTLMLDAALRSVDESVSYALSDQFVEYVDKHYGAMKALTKRQGRSVTRGIVHVLGAMNLMVRDLSVVASTLRPELVRLNLYRLTADNLRTALRVKGSISLDMAKDSTVVYQRCLAHPVDYLSAVEADPLTPHAVKKRATLVTVLNDLTSDWTDEWDDADIDRLLTLSAPESTVTDLGTAPQSIWPALASAVRFAPTLANVAAYWSEAGKEPIDEGLARLLTAARGIDVSDAPEDVDRTGLALALLNASDVIESAQLRVELAGSLGVETVPVERIKPERGTLLSLLLDHELVPDDAATFTRFQPAGWAAFGPAITKSASFEDEMTPALVAGMVVDILNDPAAETIAGRVMADLPAYLPLDDTAGLRAAAEFAVKHGMPIPYGHAAALASVFGDEPNLTMRVLAASIDALSPSELVQVVGSLGSGYQNFTTRAKNKFEVAYDEAHRVVFRKLDEAGLCSISEKNRRKTPVIEVKLT